MKRMQMMAVPGLLALTLLATSCGDSEDPVSPDEARLSAEAGIEEALVRMSEPLDSAGYIGQEIGAWFGSPGWGIYIVAVSGNSRDDPEYDLTLTDGTDNDGDSVVDEPDEHFPEVLSNRNDQRNPWVRVEYRLSPSNRALLYGDAAPVLRITSKGVSGASEYVLQVQAVREPFPGPGAAVFAVQGIVPFLGKQSSFGGEDLGAVNHPTVGGGPGVPRDKQSGV